MAPGMSTAELASRGISDDGDIDEIIAEEIAKNVGKSGVSEETKKGLKDRAFEMIVNFFQKSKTVPTVPSIKSMIAMLFVPLPLVNAPEYDKERT